MELSFFCLSGDWIGDLAQLRAISLTYLKKGYKIFIIAERFSKIILFFKV